MQSCIRRGKLLVLSSPVEIIRATEIVFGSGATNGRELLIAIHEELDFAFAPPAIVINAPGHVNTNKLPCTFNVVNNGIIGSHVRIGASKLGMKISRIVRNISQRVVNLIIQAHFILIIDVFHCNPTFLTERHLPVAVKCATGIYANCL